MARVSERARKGLDCFVMRAAQATLAAEPSDCLIAPIESDTQGTDVVMLTISSYTFRMLLFLHFEGTHATRMHFAKLCRKAKDEMTDAQFHDVMMERGNLLCGAINRDLAVYFPYIGMSTASVLGQQATAHLGAVQAKYARQYRAEVSPTVVLHITLALCIYDDLDFPFETHAETKVVSELEIF
jgi:hypothetical protein